MARTKKEIGEEIDLKVVKEKVRKTIEEKYGSVPKFLRENEFAKKLGGMKIRPHLYDSGAVNYSVLSALCEYLGIGILTRKLVVSRTYFYQLSTNVHNNEKTV